MSDYPNLDLTGRTQASTYNRLTQITSSGPGLLDLVDGLGNRIARLNLTASFSVSSSITNITQSNFSSSLFCVSASWSSASLTSISSSYSSTASYAINANMANDSLTASVVDTSALGGVFRTDVLGNITGANDIKCSTLTVNFELTTSAELVIGNSTATNFIGPLIGTASWANKAITATTATSASFASTSSWTNKAITATTATTATTSITATSASFASTSSHLNSQFGLLLVEHPIFTTSTAILIDPTDETLGGKITLRGDDSVNEGQNGVIYFDEVADFHDVSLRGGHSSVGDQSTSYLQMDIGATTNVLSLLTNSITASVPILGTNFIGTASYANRALTASYALSPLSTTLVTASTYQITSSWSNNVLTASYLTSSNLVGTVLSSSHAITASYALNGGTTLVTGALYPITSSWAISASWAPSISGGTTGSEVFSSTFSQSVIIASGANVLVYTSPTYNVSSTGLYRFSIGGCVTSSTYPLTSTYGIYWFYTDLIGTYTNISSGDLQIFTSPDPSTGRATSVFCVNSLSNTTMGIFISGSNNTGTSTDFVIARFSIEKLI